jgi:hypothetical protein
MIGQSDTSYITSNWLPIDTRDKRAFALLHRNYLKNAGGYSVAYWLFVMLAWGLLQKSCSA